MQPYASICINICFSVLHTNLIQAYCFTRFYCLHIKATPLFLFQTLLIESHKYFDALYSSVGKREWSYGTFSAISYVPETPVPSHECLRTFVYIGLYYERAIFVWQKQHQQRSMQHFDMTKVFGLTYTQVCTIANATAGFRFCIFPLNPLLYNIPEF